MNVCSNCEASNINWAEFCTECGCILSEPSGNGGVPEVALPHRKRIRFPVRNPLNVLEDKKLKALESIETLELKKKVGEDHGRGEDITQKLPRAVVDLDERLSALEEKFKNRGYDTRPMFEAHDDQIRQLQSQVKRLEERLNSDH